MTALRAIVTTSGEEPSLLGGLIFLLEEWADWQRAYHGLTAYPGRSAVIETDRYSQSFDDMCEVADIWRNKVVDSCVDELRAAPHVAVLIRYGISSVWLFPRNNYKECLEEAHRQLLIMLPKKGVAIPLRNC